MSTRAYICQKQNDGSYNAIYNHWDGYPTFLGYYLKNYYNNDELIKNLLKHGNMSAIGKYSEIPEGQEHTFDNPIRTDECSICIYYGRDRGEKGQEMQNYIVGDERELIKEFNVCGAEWVYLWKDSQWYVGKVRCRYDEETDMYIDNIEDFIPLTDEIIGGDD